jgi:hypothetical protein
MQTDIVENLDGLSAESRKKLRKQIERVQKEARILRTQARQLRRTQHGSSSDELSDVAETAQKLLGQLTRSGKEWSQNMLQRGSELTNSGVALASSQLQSGQQTLLDGSGNLLQDLGQRSSDAAQHISNWRDETNIKLRRQGRNLARNVDDLRDEAAYKLRKQGRSIGRDLVDRKDDAARKLRKQGRSVSRDLADRRDDARRKLSNQGQRLVERSGQYLNPIRERGQRAWPFLGFFAGLLLAAGVTFWFVQRGLKRTVSVEEQQIELPHRDNANGGRKRPGGEIRYASQGGAAVVTRPGQASTQTAHKFVGVVSTKQYYPVEKQPDVRDLVFFANEEAARAEGFTAAR